ncbi:hypothetical protein K466DRAFT_22946 [Polyporus arcularius HHB13444]|uniref:MYND-type domain-containing protein n=1 Tax=Polyporus arcularius HHB13444 TaxID=1314778 RepID=A0A5C3PX13_9APHY|nr:hypothetical protein K466DRAFT_22946 [Polyporus arcularius HHB13444]
MQSTETSAWQGEWERGQVRRRPRTVHQRAARHLCSSCGRISPKKLPHCPTCRSVCYCDRECQRAHYYKGHKEDCEEFLSPPLDVTFVTEPIEGEKYARDPIFAQHHQDGFGCWVSIKTSPHCELQLLANPTRANKDAHPRLPGDPGVTLDDLDNCNAHASNLLTLQVLVQNRRKDKKTGLVIGSQSRVVSFGKSTEDVLKGKTTVDGVTTFRLDEQLFASVPVAYDPFDKEPRLLVKNVDGIELKEDTRPPPAVKNAEKGILALRPGQYAILQMQYRVGDGGSIRKDWTALRLVQTLTLPVIVPWEEDRSLTAIEADFARDHAKSGATPLGMRVMFDQDAVQEFFKDGIKGGDEAHIRSHYGEKGVKKYDRETEEAKRKSLDIVKEFRRRGGTLEEALVFQLGAGMTDEALLTLLHWEED